LFPVRRTAMRRKMTAREAARRLLRAPQSAPRDAAIRKTIRQIPRGKVATYSQVAAAAVIRYTIARWRGCCGSGQLAAVATGGGGRR